MPARDAMLPMRLFAIVSLATLTVACPPQPEAPESGVLIDGSGSDPDAVITDAAVDAALFDRTGADLPAIPCDFADQAACDAHTECQWLGASCEPVATSLCGALDWAQCNTSAGCHWFYRDGTGLMPDDPDCTCDPFDLDCSCVLSCDVHAHWNTAGDVCLDSAEQPVAGLCCAVMTSYCVEDRPCPEYETPKRCGNDLRCIFIPSNDQYLPGHCDYRPDAG